MTPNLRRLAPLLALVSACAGAPTPAPRPVAKKPPPAAPAPDPEAFRAARPPSGQATRHPYPAVEAGSLDNGMTLLVVRRPAGVVTASVVARTSVSRAPQGKSGLAAVTVRMMTEGTRKHAALALSEAVESMGTTLEESAGRDFVRLGMTTLREDLDRGLTLLAEVVREPAFVPKELERVRKEWLDMLEAERQSPSRLASLVGLRALLGPAAGAPVNGGRTDVKALTRADLVRFHGETFAPDNLALVVVGDVSLADVKPVATRLFGDLRRPRRPAPAPFAPPPPPAAAGRVLLLDRPGAVQSALFLVQPFPRRAEPGHEAREVLNSLLGGVFTSRLNMNLREEHAFTYGVGSVSIATRDWGAFAVITQVRSDVTAPALGEALAELAGIKQGGARPPQGAEVDTARADLAQRLGTSLSHTEAVADRVEQLFVQQLADDYFGKYPALLDAVTPDSVTQESARLTPERLVMVVVGDAATVRPELEKLKLVVEAVPESMTD